MVKSYLEKSGRERERRKTEKGKWKKEFPNTYLRRLFTKCNVDKDILKKHNVTAIYVTITL